MTYDPSTYFHSTDELFNVIANNLGDLVAVLDTEGRRIFNSSSYSPLLGDPKDLIGTDSFEDIHPEDRQRIKDDFFETIRTGIGRTAEYRMLTRSGDARLIESNGVALRNPDGSVRNVVVISKDITERRVAEQHRQILEEEFRQAQKMEEMGTLASGVAHDFNNILAIILGYATMLEENQISTQELSKAYASIRKAAERGSNVVKQLMAFARKAGTVFEPVSINQIIQDLVGMLQETFPKTIRLETSLDSALPGFIGDGGQIHQALLNMCINARDAMGPGGVLRMSTSTKTLEKSELTFIAIEISDTGAGMNKSTREKIFEPFFTTKELGKGTGLGLSVVYGIIRGHGGMIDVQSAPNEGTKFRILLPVQVRSEEAIRPEYVERNIPSGGTETILLVEDEEMLLDLVKSVLVAYGYSVLTAQTGRQAIEVFQSHAGEIAAVISDMGMPELNGWDAFLKMKEMDPDVRAIFASGFVEEKARAEMLKMGVYAVIDKPYKPKQILQVLREAIDSHPRPSS